MLASYTVIPLHSFLLHLVNYLLRIITNTSIMQHPHNHSLNSKGLLCNLLHTAVPSLCYAVDKGLRGLNTLQRVAIDSAMYVYISQDQFAVTNQ